MHDTLNIVNQMVDLTLYNRFKIFLELTAGYLNIDAHREGVTFFEISDIRTDDLDLAVLDLL